MTGMHSDISGLNSLGEARPTGGEVSRSAGSFNGSQVKVIDVNSLISDAAEELTSELSEESEKDISDREVEDGRKSQSLERLFKLSEVGELLKSLGDLSKTDFQRAINAILRQQSTSPQALRERVQRQFEEPAHQFVALKFLLEVLKARRAPREQIEAAQTALDQLQEEKGPSIRAAINIAPTAKGFAAGALGDVPTLRDTYRTNIHDYKNLAAVLKNLIKRFGEKDVEKSIRFMTKALAADLEAGGSSIDKAELRLIINDMFRLKTLTTILGNCDILAKRARTNGALPTFTAVKVLQDLVPLLDAVRIIADQIGQFPEKAGLHDLSTQINFLTDYKELARLIPLKSYSRKESRSKLLDAIQDALNRKIRREEEEEEVEGEYER